MKYGTQFMHDVAELGQGGKMAYGADIHGELNSQAYMDIMYPAGEFDSVDHRRLMAIAERTKSVIDATLYEGIIEEKENATGGNDAEYARAIPVKPAHWATVWDTLGYTDTGFIGDYMATDLGVTGMDYEIMFNHTVPEKTWNVYLQENHITATRGIIKTAMAYALFQEKEFADDNVTVDPVGRAGFVVNPDTVTDTDENGPGTLPGGGDGIGQDGQPIVQRPYEVTNQRWFRDTNRLMPAPFRELAAADIAADEKALDVVDTLVLADEPAPADPQGRTYNRGAYFENIRQWARRGGNLVLTDRALHALARLGIVGETSLQDISVYQPYANFRDFEHPLMEGLRPNARQLVEAATLGYGIGSTASPMTVVDTAAWEAAGGHVIGTTWDGFMTEEDPQADRQLDDGALTSVGQIALGDGQVRIIGGALPTPTETQDHRFGLRNYGLTYSGLFLMENAIRHDVETLGIDPPPPPPPPEPDKPGNGPKKPKPPKR
jgi:hypothetical protein